MNTFFFNFFIFLLKMIYFNWNRITVYVCITVMVFVIYINMNHPHENMCLPILNTTQTSLVTPCFWVLPQHKSWVHLSCLELALVISFIYGNISVSMLCSQIIPSLNSPIESNSLFFIWGCREPAYCILSAYYILHIECSTFHSIIFQDLE